MVIKDQPLYGILRKLQGDRRNRMEDSDVKYALNEIKGLGLRECHRLLCNSGGEEAYMSSSVSNCGRVSSPIKLVG